MKWYSSFAMVVVMSACSSQANVSEITQQKTQYIKEECYVNEGSSLNDAFKTFMSDRQEELGGLRKSLSDENYEQLDYALSHFVTYWDQLQTERNLACEQHATCEFIQFKTPELQSNNDLCDGTDFEYSVSRAKIINFYSDIERLELQKSP
ncbi:hypothetical protein ACQKPX_10710 [Photobacterium sp. DNB23_23_1]|uniref:Lysozyme inhibitor LprI N-terminal domain-containing protein n=1 Tax=Photobacterium pectinilyticum TaxID=2906793 RepID=A0ABT1N4D6_9GAMM|nr:hypothetical protein [Photobacterium sp. ZSDE20]MCQ1059615.1 hypothetical protein [Photobacterium sp. ZSDE20]MDD1827629.1 hypothetical protein [Photobacterium sp. ZSDE20]